MDIKQLWLNVQDLWGALDEHPLLHASLGLLVLLDRKSTRLNSSHLVISYAVFCLKKKRPDLVMGIHL